MKAGIGNKISLLVVGVVLSTALIVGFVFSTGSSRVLVDKEIEDLHHHLQMKAHDLTAGVEAIRRDVLFLSRTPPVQGIIRASLSNNDIDPETGRSGQAWQDDLAGIFTARMAVEPDYFQIRLIGSADQGRELVRVDRQDAEVARIADTRLQEKGSRDYFRDAMLLEKGSVYLSKINLNREHGKISTPHLRTLRIATPVFSGDGRVFGIVIINMDIGHILDHISKDAYSSHSLYITNDQGDFLEHPDAAKAFGFDLGKTYRLQDEIPALGPAFQQFRSQAEMAIQTSGESHELIQLVKAFIDPEQPNRFLAVVHTTPREVVTAEAAQLRKSGFYTALALAVIGAVVAFSFARLLTWPLQQITSAASLVSKGERNVRLPTQRDDEIGVLAGAFQKMLIQIREREQTINEGQKRLSATLNTVVNGIVTINERGIIDSVNPAIEHMFGYTADELIGQNVSILMPGHYAEQHNGYIRNYLETGDRKVIGALRELTGQHKGGEQFPILLAVSETQVQGRRFFVGAIQNLTELQSSEERTKRLGNILETSTNEIFVFEYPGLKLKESNLASRTNLGYGQERLEQMNLFDLFPKSEHGRIESALKKFEDSSSTEEHLDALFRRQDDSIYPVELRLFLSKGKDDMVGVMIAHDITERHQQMEKLRAYAQRLESSNRELQDFAFVASHDLQEPLRKVQAFGDRLKVNESDNLSARGQDYIDRMQKAAARMQILINDLLMLSRVTTQGRPFEAVDLDQIAHEVMGDLEARIQDAGGEIELGPLPTLKADPLQMRQLLQNLLGNALKFHRPGIAPHVRLTSELVDTTTDAPAHYIITVEDNGIGFDNRYADRIFTPFERLHSRQEYEGTGMGLALCKKIVERHGGTITAQGHPDEGTVFTITLPENFEG